MELNSNFINLYNTLETRTQRLRDYIPLGSIIASHSPTKPDSTWLDPVESLIYNVADYPDFVARFPQFIKSDDTTKFIIPNINDRYLRQIGSHINLNETVEDAIRNISGQPVSVIGTVSSGSITSPLKTVQEGTTNIFGSSQNNYVQSLSFDASRVVPTTTDDTRPKSIGVKYYIKAKLNEITLAPEVYSLSEVLTNKIWINGSPIYRKVITAQLGISTILKINIGIPFAKVTDQYGIAVSNETQTIPIPYRDIVIAYVNSSQLWVSTTDDRSGYFMYYTVEYYK